VLETAREGRVLIVRVDNPPHNLFDRTLVRELSALASALAQDRAVGSVVLTGKPHDQFITHYDNAEMLEGSDRFGISLPPTPSGLAFKATTGTARVPGVGALLGKTPAAGMLDLDGILQLFRSIERLDKVVIAAINGPALGAGAELSLACDLRYMAAEAGAFGSPEMAQGFTPGAGGTQRYARSLLPAQALEHVLEASMPPPQQALELGLVHRVVPRADLLETALETAHRLARRAPISIAAAKRAVYEGSRQSLEGGLALERRWFLAAVSQPAPTRAMRRYVEELERDGRGPWEQESAYKRWRDGKALELV
jgi:enoyl-CoA hydratase